MGGFDLAHGYSAARRADPRIEALIRTALGEAQSVVNVGAGAGSYEPAGLEVVAVEPNATMIAQRPPGAAPAIRASAEALPLPDDAVDAGMAILTLHHWEDLEAGLRELRRVVRGRIVLLHWEPALTRKFWFVREYLPVIATWERDVPTARRLGILLGEPVEVVPVPVPHDCTDGFLGAYWRRPEQYLDPVVRASISSLAALGDRAASGLLRLHADLESGAWARRHADLLARDELDVGYRLVIAG